MVSARQRERHRTGKGGWLRAAVLGANDGILSTSSLVLGVVAAHGSHSSVLIAGVAGVVAGAMSMAAGEYVSVHSQADTEQADLALERTELKTDNPGEHAELTAIYVGRGLDTALAKQVADKLMAHDALGAHARDELGLSEALKARPIQAALASAGSFRLAAARDRFVTRTSDNCLRLCRVSAFPGLFRWSRGASRWRSRDYGCDQGHVLGSNGDGDNCGRRRPIWKVNVNDG
jgi:hypothetical protein